MGPVSFPLLFSWVMSFLDTYGFFFIDFFPLFSEEHCMKAYIYQVLFFISSSLIDLFG